jgi:GT2 family glycosyltransferase
VSVVVVNYCGEDVLGPFLDSVLDGPRPPREVIVVDNASTDGSLELLRARPGVRVVASPDDLGFGRGANLGATHATGELLLFANPDVILRDDTIACLARDLLATPGAAIATANLVEPDKPLPERTHQIEEVAAMSGALMLIERAHFDRIGGFDPAIFLYSEDTDICYRTVLAGRRVVKVWDAVGTHEAHGSGGGPRWSAEQIKNGLYVYLTARSAPAVVRYSGRMAVKTVVRGIRFRDPTVVGAWVATARRLPATLDRRRQIRGAAAPAERARLDRLAREHDYWQRVNWRRSIVAGLRRRVGRTG